MPRENAITKEQRDYVIEVIREYQPIRAKEIIELTKEEVNWSTAYHAQLSYMMEKEPRLYKPKFAHYAVRATDEESADKKSTQETLPVGSEDTGKTEEKSEKVKSSSKKTEKDKNEEPAKSGKKKKSIDTLKLSEESKQMLKDFHKMREGYSMYTNGTIDSEAEPKPAPKPAKPKAPVYKAGDEVTGIVSGIEDYGAFLRLWIDPENGDDISGLIHISNMKDQSVIDVEQHFKLGDAVTAKVIAIRKHGKIALSTVGYELPDYFANSPLASQLKPVADKIKQQQPTAPVPTEPTNEVTVYMDKEMQDVYKHVQSITNAAQVTDEAKQRLSNLVREHGIFTFMMKFMEVSKEFETMDLLALFTNELEKKLGDGL